MTVSRTTSHED